jgi:GT2 family glycosyltransferase
MRNTIAFIIIAYHPNVEELRALVRLLTDHPTIVVDNGGTLTLNDVGRATLLAQTKNLGYGAAANIGIHHASGLGSTWFVILNQDTTFTKDSIRSFCKALRKLPPCLAGPFAAGLDEKRWTAILPSDRIDYLTGSCLAIHEKVVRKIGYFFEPYFIYYEDAEYCVRAKRANFSLEKLDIAEISHEESLSLGKGSWLHQYYLARNHLLFVHRLAPNSVKLYELVRGIKTVPEHIVRREFGALAGIKDFLFGRFGEYQGRGV